MNHQFLGEVAGVISALAFIPYIVEAIWGKTKPNRATWAIWFLVWTIVCFSYRSASESHEAWWVTVSYMIGSLLVFLISLKRGVGGWEPLDLVCLTGALFGALLWWIFNSPITALIMNLAMDFLGLIPTLKKSWIKPKEESFSSWGLSTLAGVINLFAVSDWESFSTIALPVYALAAVGSVWVILVIRRLQKIQ